MTVQVVSTTRARRRSRVEQEKSIFELKSGAHKGKFLVKAPNGRDAQGKLLYKRFGPFVDLGEAIAARDKHVVSLAEAVVKGVTSLPVGREAAPQTLRQWTKHHIDVQQTNDNTRNTVAKTRDSFERLILPYLGDIILAALTRQQIEAWLRTLQTKKVGRPSINHALKRLKTCLNAAVAAGVLKANPAGIGRGGVKLLPTKKLRRESSFSDYPKLIAAAGDNYLARSIQVGVDSGLRASELCALHVGDLELDRKDAQGRPAPRVHLRWHLVTSKLEDGSIEHAFRPGTKASDGEFETVEISPRTAIVLREHLVRLAEHKMQARPWAKRAGKATEVFYAESKNDACTPAHKRYVVPAFAVAPDALVFPGEDGTPMIPNSYTGWLTRIAKKAGVSKTPHGMRHDCGSFMLARGVPLTVVSRHLRHATPGFTATVYAHQIREQERAGADAMDGLWASLEAQAEAV